MNKKYIIRCFLTAAFIFAAGTAFSQGEVDSLQQKVPGAMFSVPQSSNTAAVSSVSGDDLYRTPAVNISNSLVGRLPGMTLMQGSGLPGGDDAMWLIRGIGSHGYGGYNTAKIFVDGFEVNPNYFTSLSPAEIESVSILKDGAALTIFGDRGANGVIWVTTKRGTQGPLKVTANVRSGLQAPTKINKPLGSYDYAYLYNVAASNDARRWKQPYSTNELIAYQQGLGVDVDWYDEVMKKSGHYVDGDVTFRGGSDNARYFVVLGYLNQQGLFDVKNDRDRTSNVTFQRFNVRANLDFNVGKIVEASIDLGGKLQGNKAPWDQNGEYPWNGAGDIMGNLATYPNNIYNIWDDQSREHWSGTSLYPNNPVAALNARGYRTERLRILQGNFTIKEKLDVLTKGLYLSQSFSINNATKSSQNRIANYMRWHNGVGSQTTDLDSPIKAGRLGSDGMDDWKQGTVNIGYDNSWDRHTLNAAAGMHLSAYKGDGYFSYKYNFLNYRVKVHYNYDNRYSAELSLSTFGNDSYAPDYRWSVYPAISGAWVISNEEFMKGVRNVDLFRLRASFGSSGSSDSGAANSLYAYSGSNGRFLYKDYYTGSSYFGSFYTGEKNGTSQGSLQPMFIPNPEARSETSYKYNVGVDLSMFNKRLNISADAFYDRRKDILTFNANIPHYYGWNDQMLNIGEMKNRGFELMVDWSDKKGDWFYALNGSVSFNRSKIIESGEVAKRYAYNQYTGNPYGTNMGLIAEGFYGIEDFNDNGSLKEGISVPLFGDVQPGDIRYRDLNGNGYIDDDDITKIGKSIYPEWTYSLRAQVGFKGFDLDILFQGIAGAEVNLLNQNREVVVPFVNDRTIYRIADNSWAYYPEQGLDNRSNATYPRLSLEDNQNNYRSSSFWIESMNFLKLRHIELGYTFNMQSETRLRIYLNAANPLTFSRLMRKHNIDPERMGSLYPSLQSYTLGVSLSF